jgi:hypothetical protein
MHNECATFPPHERCAACQAEGQRGAVDAGRNPVYFFEVPGYDELAGVLRRAYGQAAVGKGKERHAGKDNKPFELQPMSTINREQGSIDGFLYQARKKALEAKGLPDGRAQAELLGAINYLAGAVIALDTWAAGTLPQPTPPAAS